MERLIEKYLAKLRQQHLADGKRTLFLAIDAELYSNQPCDAEVGALSAVFDRMNISSFLIAEPREPYRTILRELTRTDRPMFPRSQGADGIESITPMDCETRTFFHDIPVLERFTVDDVVKALSRRKSVVVGGERVATYGVVTPEQAFVSFSSTCFSTFVAYFYDSLKYFEACRVREVEADAEFAGIFDRVCAALSGIAPGEMPCLAGGIPKDEDEVVRRLVEAGKALVQAHLVDSYFGNISYIFDGAAYISQTGSSLDELETCIDRVPLDGTSSVGITASSELSAHTSIYRSTGLSAILHGHPKFSVIMSMDCPHRECQRLDCFKSCPEKRSISGIPIVPGEIGRGPTGLMHTVPPAMRDGHGVIVHGHGVFTAGAVDFSEPFDRLVEIEEKCRKAYFEKIAGLRRPAGQ
jgi:ribulose-5-phosphate 4-epimerase/fuculose-1-phosphate aldolase